jgi:hypothetical protein
MRTAKLPTILGKYSVYYDERHEWPASPYYKARLEEALEGKAGRHECESSDFFTIEEFEALGFKHPFRAGSKYEFDQESTRVKQVRKKWAACPIGGTKGQNIPKALQYVNVIKGNGLPLDDRYSTVVAIRTQPGPPGEGKVRDVEAVSTPDWIISVEGFGDALTQTDLAIDIGFPILLFHTRPEMIGKWFAKYESEVVSWLSWDWTGYDQNLAAQLMEVVARFGMNGYPFADQEVEFMLNCSIMGPWGTVTRYGANISGHLSTNWLNSLTNILHFLKVLDGLGLLRYVVCVLVNGDDIVIGFSTRLTPDNIEKINKRSFMVANTTKVDCGNGIWHSKLAIEKDTTGKIIISRVPELVWNRIKYPERRKTLESVKWIVSMGIASTTEGLVIPEYEHPVGTELLRFIAEMDEVDLSTATDAELMPSAEIMAAEMSWRDITTAQDWIDFIRNTRYVRRDF